MNVRRFSLALCLTVPILISSVAVADSIDCVRTAQGQTVIWNSEWQNDHQDDGVQYQISKIGRSLWRSEGVNVQLHALDSSAARPQRSVEVNSPLVARLLCSAIVRKKLAIPDFPSIGRNEDAPPPRSVEAVSPPKPRLPTTSGTKVTSSNLPFIYFSENGWVRGDPPNGKELSLCTVLTQKFSCLLSDRKHYADQLKLIEEELRAFP